MCRKLVYYIIIIILSYCSAFAQTDKEKAQKIAEKAVLVMDEGKTQESIKLLSEALLLDPDNLLYKYEIAYANCLEKKYKNAIEILEPIKNHRDSFDQLFQMLGNCYDYEANPDKAIQTYNEGLVKFPKSGKLYLELGNVYLNMKNYDTSLFFYEKGIESDPSFPSNYYWACKLFMNTTEKVWGMIYGEIFMNLERNSKRTQEISKLLYQVYKSQIEVKDKSMAVSFSKNNVIRPGKSNKPEDVKYLFGTLIYEMVLSISYPFFQPVNLGTLSLSRQNFITNYVKKEFNKKYPIVLFDYQKKIADAGLMEPYTYWILMKGDEDAFEKWQSANKDKWDAFVLWFTDNPLIINETNKFFSKQYTD